MKRKSYVLFACLLTAIVAFAQSKETRDLPDFDGIAASAGIDVILEKGPNPQAVVEARGDLDDIKTEVDGGVLKVGFKTSKMWEMWKSRNHKATVYVQFQDLDYVKVSSGANVDGKSTIRSKDLEVSASSGGNMNIAVQAGYLTGKASSGGNLFIEGTAVEADVRASSGGNFKGRSLEIKHCTAKASSGGNVSVTALESINSSSSSGGNVRFSGNPRSRSVSKSKSSSY